ncbi:asparagine synthase (glutamine-hydrolyzing) [Candidatus Woesearchaeota archaeon]|nr:asparagine synthase (glutamine-hydrolyzing) [Candidatus Woesearchaeota archaeon]
MCGIIGFNWEDRELIGKMNEVIEHRGPDDNGSYTDKGVSLGQRRLSILDLSNAGHQPTFYSKETGAFSEIFNKEEYNKFLRGRLKSITSIVFNGEIYNFKELRSELSGKGYSFNTKTDTEVILAGYIEWGTECVKKFNGMWSFCIHDHEKNIFFCSRDRLGQKPFYYYLKDGKFIFASELKSILEYKDLGLGEEYNINKDALDLYFSLGFIPSPYSIYKDVYKLEPRYNMIFDLEKKELKKWEYYEIDGYDPVYDKKEIIEEGKNILRDATRLRMIADVPVGAFLSGGLDSSVVVGAMKDFTDLSNLNTFSIGFEGKFDESEYIHIAKDYFGTKHHHRYFKEDDFQNLVGKYASIYDEPLGDYSCFPTYDVSRMARKNVTISLSGDGGDEMFGGYNVHVLGKRMEIIRKIPWIFRKIGAKIPSRKNLNSYQSLFLLKEAFRLSLSPKENIYSDALPDLGFKPKVYNEWTKKNMKYCLEKSKGNLGEAMRLNDLLFNTLPDNFLVKVDRASMANSLEVRSPFLDYRFIEFSQKIPSRWKTSLFKTKKIMRDIIKDIVPEKIVKRGKQGFTPPLERWILNEKYEKDLNNALEYVKKLSLDAYEFYLNKALKEDNTMYNIYKIRLFLFGKWYEKWIR